MPSASAWVYMKMCVPVKTELSLHCTATLCDAAVQLAGAAVRGIHSVTSRYTVDTQYIHGIYTVDK